MRQPARPAVTVLRVVITVVCLLISGYFVLYAVAMLRDPPEMGRVLGLLLLGIAGLFLLGAIAAVFFFRPVADE